MALPVINPADFLPVPQAIDVLDFEALFQAWLAEFKTLFPDYDVGGLETDPGVIVAQAMSFVRLDDRADINDKYQALRLALATGANLDGLAADRGVVRLTYVPADPVAGAPAIMEDDNTLRVRTWLRMQTWGSGTPFGIEYHARTVGLADVSDAKCNDFSGEGRCQLVLLQAANSTADFNSVLANISAYVMDRRRRPGAVWIDTQAADDVTVNITGTLGVRRGASQASVVSSATSALTTYMQLQRRIGTVVPISALHAAGHVTDVVYFHIDAPAADVQLTNSQAPVLGAISLTPVLVDE